MKTLPNGLWSSFTFLNNHKNDTGKSKCGFIYIAIFFLNEIVVNYHLQIENALLT